MTEAEWLACVDPQALFDHHARYASQRKLRLAAVACARLVWPLLADRWSREAIEVAERFADRAVDRHDIAVAREGAADAVRWAEENAPGEAVPPARAALSVTAEQAEEAARLAAKFVGQHRASGDGATLCGLVRDVFGNPFRHTIVNPSWLGRDGGLKMLARTLYDKRKFDDLPALAAALEGEGCRDAAVLEHLRSAGPHVRGCWVLDLLTGRT